MHVFAVVTLLQNLWINIKLFLQLQSTFLVILKNHLHDYGHSANWASPFRDKEYKI